ncbi:MAG: PQQ-like beta-propeller repeat protein [Sedimentisphaerales bacterium]|nr:PQQ-like beta-propeller repeat protein [Sedimentisphaerales bacterium]
MRGITVGTDGTVYFSTSGGNNTFYALTNGVIKWTNNTGSQGSTPAIGADGTIYCGYESGRLYAITNGVVKWFFPMGIFVYSSPVVGADNTIYIGSDDNSIYAVTNGIQKWSYNTGGDLRNAAAIGIDGTVYVGSYNGKLFAITNGVVKWSNGNASDIRSSPAIGPDNTIYCAGYGDRTVYAVTNGVVKWTCPLPGGVIYTSPSLGPDGTVYICNWNADHRLYAITNGAVKWSFDPGDSTIYSSPTVDNDGYVYFGAGDGNLYCISNGNLKWSYPTGGRVDSSPAIGPDGAIYFGSLDDTLYVVKQNDPPLLAWSSFEGFYTDGVHPNTNNSGALFTFRINYSDADNHAAVTNQIWIDLNDDQTYQSNEKFVLDEVDTNDNTYTDGKEFIYTNRISLSGDGKMSYRFFFSDSLDVATGSPVINNYFYFIIPETIYSDLENALAAPNPVEIKAEQDYITFFNLTVNFEIRIYSIGGSQLNVIQGRSVNGQYKWHPVNRDGNTLKPGVYLCLLTNPDGQKKMLKFVIY